MFYIKLFNPTSMKKISTNIIAIFFLLFSYSAMAQDVETSATNNQEMIEEAQPEYAAEEPVESKSVEELKALEKESKAKEKAALKEAKQAKKLEKQIQKTKNAEARAKKARRLADDQAEKTKNAIDDYMSE